MMKEAYRDEGMSQATFYRWFFGRQEQVNDENRCGALNCMHTAENIEV